jgi:hypothetical protein
MLASIYLLLSIGVGFSVHYCGGKVKSIDPMFVASACCCSTMDVDMGCCEDELHVFQLDDEQQLAQSFSVDFDLTKTLLPLPAFKVQGTAADTEIVNPELYDLPPPDPTPLYLRYGKLILYG